MQPLLGPEMIHMPQPTIPDGGIILSFVGTSNLITEATILLSLKANSNTQIILGPINMSSRTLMQDHNPTHLQDFMTMRGE